MPICTFVLFRNLFVAQPSHSPATQRHDPLHGVRVCDMSRVLAGPFCSLILADLGAEVIEIEEIGVGDETRTIPPFVNGESLFSGDLSQQIECGARCAHAGRAGNFAHARAVMRCGENFLPGVMARLGLGYDALHAQKPDMILCSISGFGTTGALRDKPSFDLVTQAPFLRMVTSRRGSIRRRCSVSIRARCWVR